MKIRIVTPRITTYELRFDSNDEFYFRCMWARVSFDHEHYTMTAVSDCGDYSYSWCPTPKHESFIHLMKRVDKSYLLNKISSRSEFLFDESRQITIENLERYFNGEDKEKLSEAIDDLKEIDKCSAEMWYMQASEICGEWLDFESIGMEYEYPAGAQTFVELFKECIQPNLVEELAAMGAQEEQRSDA